MSSIEKVEAAVQSVLTTPSDLRSLDELSAVIARAVIDSLAQATISDETIMNAGAGVDTDAEYVADVRDSIVAPLAARIAQLEFEKVRAEALYEVAAEDRLDVLSRAKAAETTVAEQAETIDTLSRLLAGVEATLDRARTRLRNF